MHSLTENYWAVFHPDGEMALCTVRYKRANAIDAYREFRTQIGAGGLSWKQLYRRGWRVKKIYVSVDSRDVTEVALDKIVENVVLTTLACPVDVSCDSDMYDKDKCMACWRKFATNVKG